MDKPLHTLSLTEVLTGIESRRFTCEAYTQGLLSRIASLDGEIQAWAWLEPGEGDRGGPPFRQTSCRRP